MKREFNPLKQFLIYAFIIIIIVSVYQFVDGAKKPYAAKVSEFLDWAESGTIEEIQVTKRQEQGVIEVVGTLETYNEGETFVVLLLDSDYTVGYIHDLVGEDRIVANINPEKSTATIWLILAQTIPFLIIVVIIFFFITKNAGGAGKAIEFGKSRAKLNESGKKVTFEDVAGLDEEKEEVEEMIDFLKDPKRFQKMGARIPKGILLVGPPGTGKTLLARGVAGEANVPFYSISGSDFVEMFVGVGASRVRDMFKQAKKSAPCVIFIDEIDAVGRQRGAGLGGGHDEREQTLNQLLVEMDGFGENEGIIVIAATNRPDVLDPALLRPGRFDRRVMVNNPDVKAREAILKVHARNKKFADEVNFKNLAKRTPGYSGADLENLLNEAALLAVRNNKNKIDMKDVDEAADRVIMGPAKKSKKYSDKERRLVAHHEAGHVVLGIKLNDASEVHKVTIVPRGQAGGYAMMIPKEDNYFQTKKDLLERITGLLGGRASEEIMFGEVTTGAHNDFEKATKIARAMVTEYGMSDLGPVQLEHQEGNVFLGRDYGKHKNFSDKVAHEIDTQVRKIIDGCYSEAKRILGENKELLVLIAETLLKHETLTKEQIDELVESGKLEEDKGPLEF